MFFGLKLKGEIKGRQNMKYKDSMNNEKSINLVSRNILRFYCSNKLCSKKIEKNILK